MFWTKSLSQYRKNLHLKTFCMAVKTTYYIRDHFSEKSHGKVSWILCPKKKHVQQSKSPEEMLTDSPNTVTFPFKLDKSYLRFLLKKNRKQKYITENHQQSISSRKTNTQIDIKRGCGFGVMSPALQDHEASQWQSCLMITQKDMASTFPLNLG